MFMGGSMGMFWILVAAATLILEIVSLGLTTIWFTGGAIVASIVAFAGASIGVQIVVFIVVSAVLLISIRPLAKKWLKVGDQKTNVDSLIGRVEKVVVTVDNNEKTGMIRIGDIEWRAVSVDGSVIPEGTLVKVEKIEGTRLYVRRELEM